VRLDLKVDPLAQQVQRVRLVQQVLLVQREQLALLVQLERLDRRVMWDLLVLTQLCLDQLDRRVMWDQLERLVQLALTQL
jgi:hypothetical protein